MASWQSCDFILLAGKCFLPWAGECVISIHCSVKDGACSGMSARGEDCMESQPSPAYYLLPQLSTLVLRSCRRQGRDYSEAGGALGIKAQQEVSQVSSTVNDSEL